MDEFVSTYTNRLDSKGRVSIPAAFRAVLTRDGFDGLYCCPTLDGVAVDAGGNRLMEAIRERLSRHERFSPEHDDLSTTFMAQSERLGIDGEGRVILTDTIKGLAGIADKVTFVGQGYKFQIWEPDRFLAYREQAMERVRALRQGSRSPSGSPTGRE
jgi:MraZ protein